MQSSSQTYCYFYRFCIIQHFRIPFSNSFSLQNQNGFSVANSTQFRNDISSTTISEDESMVSFDVVFLFTAIPVDKACAYIKTKLINGNTLPDRTQLDIDDILRLLKFVLSNSYFIYNDVTYK